MKLHELLNQMSDGACLEALKRCCGSHRWAESMLNSRPFHSQDQVFKRAEDAWTSLERTDYLEAFSHHPKIGANIDTLRKKFAPTADWSSSEQSNVTDANEETLVELAKGNQKYLEKFGYIFIVCATGKSAEEMLNLLNDRLNSSSDAELMTAAAEQSKITKIRLEKLLI